MESIPPDTEMCQFPVNENKLFDTLKLRHTLKCTILSKTALELYNILNYNNLINCPLQNRRTHLRQLGGASAAVTHY